MCFINIAQRYRCACIHKHAYTSHTTGVFTDIARCHYVQQHAYVLNTTCDMRSMAIAQRCCYVPRHASMLHTTCVSLPSLNDAVTLPCYIQHAFHCHRSTMPLRFRVTYNMRFIAIAQRCRYASALHTTCFSLPSLNGAVRFVKTPPCYIQHAFHGHRSTMPLRSSTRFRVITNNMRFITIAQRCRYVHRHASELHTTCAQLSLLKTHAGVTYNTRVIARSQRCCYVNYYVSLSM
jgi:hypothetical protein